MSVYGSHLKNVKEDKEILIGTIDFEDDYLEESLKENLGGKAGNCKIFVWTGNEGNFEPHFHIQSIGSANFDGCVKIYEPDYFPHGIHKSTFSNSSQKLKLNEFLKKPYKKDSTFTNWMYISDKWKNSFGITPGVKYTDEQPDYTKLP